MNSEAGTNPRTQVVRVCAIKVGSSQVRFWFVFTPNKRRGAESAWATGPGVSTAAAAHAVARASRDRRFGWQSNCNEFSMGIIPSLTSTLSSKVSFNLIILIRFRMTALMVRTGRYEAMSGSRHSVSAVRKRGRHGGRPAKAMTPHGRCAQWVWIDARRCGSWEKYLVAVLDEPLNQAAAKQAGAPRQAGRYPQ